jgi:cytochrome c553
MKFGLRAVVALMLVCLAAACHPIPNDTEARLTATGELVALSGGGGGPAAACITCHGLEGQGDGDSVPRLGGLDAGYLQKQLEDYASGIRQDAKMATIARRLSDADRRAVSLWYAQRPVVASGTGAGEAAPSIYRVGDPQRGIVACASCHGDEGEGRPGSPALAGQPAAYTIDQLRRWQRAARRNDPRGVMVAAAARLNDAEMAATAAWLERRSASRPPDSAVANVSAAASASAQPAGSRATRRPDR